ncbi:NAD(P)/FAD-dependent oxidoreductase [Pseudotabrizicola sp. L79]|uniref:NAD(P)/FAD-dependent oxidoreductase n=1 Tax=Pseudotabrizicola sp. L79 TaxID=3118402 RepID=UPI002F9280CB
MARVDLTVMGAGIFGLACAWEALRRGARVRVIESVAIGAGSSGGLVGALAPHVPENWNPKKQFQLESLLMAQGFWQGVAAASGLSPGYARLGRWQVLADAEAVARAQARADEAAVLWRGQALWRVVPLKGAAWEPVSPAGFLIEDTLTARLHPRMAAAALVAAIRARGGEVVLGEAAPEGAVIWATGHAGLVDLNAALGKRVGSGVKGQSALLRLAVPDQPQIYAPGLHVVPHEDGTVAIGSTSENEWDDARSVDGQLEELLAKAEQVCPALHGAEVVERWAGVRPRARSRAPMLGAWPGRAGQFIANGGFKIGFGMAPKVAAVMADLVLEGRDTIPQGFRVEDCL